MACSSVEKHKIKITLNHSSIINLLSANKIVLYRIWILDLTRKNSIHKAISSVTYFVSLWKEKLWSLLLGPATEAIFDDACGTSANLLPTREKLDIHICSHGQCIIHGKIYIRTTNCTADRIFFDNIVQVISDVYITNQIKFKAIAYCTRWNNKSTVCRAWIKSVDSSVI
jgi:hypothetical protein